MSATSSTFSATDLEALKAFDTPTICNALEVIDPKSRGYGYTSETFFCARPQLPPIVGFAKTVTIRATQPGSRSPEDARAHRLQYLKFVSEGPRPAIIVVQDLDDNLSGRGSFWGEVHSTIHQSLGAVGAITNGAVRDVTSLAAGFQILARKVVPSHAFDHLVDFGGEVNVCGMVVKTGDVVHADQHGAVIVPATAVAKLPAAAGLVSRREAVLLEACAAPGFDYDALVRALGAADQIH
jgi:regulator of RNase E activity RraA